MKFFRKSWKNQLSILCKYIVLIVAAIVCIYPFIWVVISSFKNNNEIFGNPFGFPSSLKLENYIEAWAGADVGQNFLNSMIVCVSTVVILMVITSMGSYILTRVKKIPILDIYFSLGIMIPIHALLIPSVLIFKNIKLTDNLLSLVIMYTAVNISFSMFIMNGFLKNIPRELDEAATIDGCGKAQTFFHIIFPIAKPGLATVATLAFLNCWNDLLMGLVLISSPAKKTLSLAISALKGSYATRYGLLCAGFVISIVPVVIMYLLFQRQVIAGMTAGAVKG